MSLKLARLKKWLTLEDSASYLSLLLSEEVKPDDLLQLAAQKELTLSLSIPASYHAAPYKEDADKEVLSLDIKAHAKEGSPEYRACLFGMLEYSSFCLRHEGSGYSKQRLGPDFTDFRTVSGVWDLSMFGAELELITEMAGLPTAHHPNFKDGYRLENNKPIILRDINEPELLLGLIGLREDESLEVEIENPDLQKILLLTGYSCRKVQQFPPGTFIVIRPENLQTLANRIANDFQTAMPGETSQDNSPEKTELRRTQRTLAALSIGLAHKHGTYRHGEKPNVSALAEVATEHLRDANGRPPHGFSDKTARDAITAALETLSELTEHSGKEG